MLKLRPVGDILCKLFLKVQVEGASVTPCLTARLPPLTYLAYTLPLVQDAQSCTFRPDTGNAVEVLAFSERAGHLLETDAERYERMALEEAAR